MAKPVWVMLVAHVKYRGLSSSLSPKSQNVYDHILQATGRSEHLYNMQGRVSGLEVGDAQVCRTDFLFISTPPNQVD